MTADEQFRHNVESKLDDIDSKPETIGDKLFVGNGTPPITVQIDRLNTFKKISCWLFCVIFLSGVGAISSIIVSKYFQ